MTCKEKLDDVRHYVSCLLGVVKTSAQIFRLEALMLFSVMDWDRRKVLMEEVQSLKTVRLLLWFLRKGK